MLRKADIEDRQIKVEAKLEQQSDHLNELLSKKLFSEDEVHEIAKQRKHFEYSLMSELQRPLKKKVYLQYLEFELNLLTKEKLRFFMKFGLDYDGKKKKDDKSQQPKDKKKEDSEKFAKMKTSYLHKMHINGIFKRAGMIFFNDPFIWKSFLDFSLSNGFNVDSNVKWILDKNPLNIDLHIIAAKFYYEYLMANDAARGILQKCLRINKKYTKLWTEMFKLEMSIAVDDLLSIVKTKEQVTEEETDMKEAEKDDLNAQTLIAKKRKQQHEKEMSVWKIEPKVRYSGALAVLNGAIEEHPNNFSFRMELLSILETFPLTNSIFNEYIKKALDAFVSLPSCQAYLITYKCRSFWKNIINELIQKEDEEIVKSDEEEEEDEEQRAENLKKWKEMKKKLLFFNSFSSGNENSIRGLDMNEYIFSNMNELDTHKNDTPSIELSEKDTQEFDLIENDCWKSLENIISTMPTREFVEQYIEFCYFLLKCYVSFKFESENEWVSSKKKQVIDKLCQIFTTLHLKRMAHLLSENISCCLVYFLLHSGFFEKEDPKILKILNFGLEIYPKSEILSLLNLQIHCNCKNSKKDKRKEIENLIFSTLNRIAQPLDLTSKQFSEIMQQKPDISSNKTLSKQQEQQKIDIVATRDWKISMRKKLILSILEWSVSNCKDDTTKSIFLKIIDHLASIVETNDQNPEEDIHFAVKQLYFNWYISKKGLDEAEKIMKEILSLPPTGKPILDLFLSFCNNFLPENQVLLEHLFTKSVLDFPKEEDFWVKYVEFARDTQKNMQKVSTLKRRALQSIPKITSKILIQ